ncbi:MAG: DinB family protein [Ignavibacteria bacterium]|nr:DinB family protein [Ignavibacteria bacterium]MCU7505159.1 DinB family protein [Ignavibacteria bacterium]MCU7517988.1 DinB family protein [Ignavibacteria bacterium]
MESAIMRPDPTEYAPYYEQYVSAVPDGDLLHTLELQLETASTLFKAISDAQAIRSYQPDKWTIKQVLRHVIDAERIFTMRALRFARGDRQELPGFDQDEYVRQSDCNEYPWHDLVEEFQHVRRSTISLFRSLPPDAWFRKGVASKFEVTVRALAFITAGHERHHTDIIRTRYL